MKLLTQTHIKTIKQKRVDETVERENRVKSSLSKKIESLNKIKDELEIFRLNRTEEVTSEIERLETQRVSLENEVQVLEERHRIALEPLEQREQFLEAKIRNNQAYQKTLEAQKLAQDVRDAEIRTSVQELKQERLEVNLLHEKIEGQITNLNQSSQRYEEVLTQVGIEQNKFEQYKKTELDKLTALQAKADLTLEETRRDKAVITFEREALAKDRKIIASERAALSAAIQEAKKKGVWVNQTTTTSM